VVFCGGGASGDLYKIFLNKKLAIYKKCVIVYSVLRYSITFINTRIKE